MKRFINDFKKYIPYVRYSAKSTLKSEVAGSYLSWIWWILDPLLFMLVYTFIVQVVFRKAVPHFHIFVFIGLNVWKLFNSVVLQSTGLIRQAKGILSKIYIPKFAMLFSKIMVATYKMIIAFSLVFIMCVFERVPLTIHVLWCIPLLLLLMYLSFGISLIMMHIGVYLKDLHNIMTVGLRLVYYMSGIFYDLDKNVPAPYNKIILGVNPVAYIIQGIRNVILYQSAPNELIYLMWSVVGTIFIFIGVSITYRYENTYIKVV